MSGRGEDYSFDCKVCKHDYVISYWAKGRGVTKARTAWKALK